MKLEGENTSITLQAKSLSTISIDPLKWVLMIGLVPARNETQRNIQMSIRIEF
jgi:hypothetical protein